MIDIDSLFADLIKPAPVAMAQEEMEGLDDLFAELVAKKPAKTRRERYIKEAAFKREHIAFMDFESDKFDAVNDVRVKPFACGIVSKLFDPIVIWENDYETFLNRVIEEITNLPDRFTIYAHNGGKFDFQFLLSKMRGKVGFKGRSIMSADIGRHRLRDSFHILPESLKSLNGKMDFDYSKLDRDKRENYREEITAYMLDDCYRLLDIVLAFIDRNGVKLSIGQAAIAGIKEHYKFECLGESGDAALRPFFFGGRVECIGGRRQLKERFDLYDVNSMYPAVMANFEHPVGKHYVKRVGKPGPNTVFIDLTCRSRGAFVRRDDDGSTSASVGKYRFQTTIWEYETALRLRLISDVEIHYCIDNNVRTNFAEFVLPRYAQRQSIKEELEFCSAEKRQELLMQSTLIKLELNNAYGKFAQNPRRYKEDFLTDVGGRPPEDEANPWNNIPSMYPDYWIFQRPNPSWRFNNVGTGASITGAARAQLLEAIYRAEDPIYCDTDSIICRHLEGVEIHKSNLGAWDLEKQISEIIIVGKKTYAYRTLDGKEHLRSKGVNLDDWNDYIRMYNGETIPCTAFGETLTRGQSLGYMKRNIRATAPLLAV